ncbi:flagellar basal body rod C-terminal domain-containing protein [Buchnera aphidicola (Kurisakia onigurumii)]|uniref:flagellar basal body rod C-terminal domain-containing protein n=1 Tax=Buchnera aphidicola TaxID=9 RepID=UPI0031B72269
MDKAIYYAANKANFILNKQEINSNNITNISTPGFKEKFISILNKKINSNKNNKINNNIVEIFQPSFNNFPGVLKKTDKILDIALNKKDFWFSVLNENLKKTFFTRNGNISVNKKNELNILGNPILGDDNKKIIIPKNSNIKILQNGMIQVIIPNNLSVFNKVIDIGKIKVTYLNRDEIYQSNFGNLYLKKNIIKKNRIKKNNYKIFSGTLEDSNVSPTNSMVNMISNAREFEMNMKIISYCNEKEKMANQCMIVNN